MAKEEEFYTDYNYELFTDNDNDDEPATMSECSLFLVQHMIDDEFVASLMTPQRLIDYINMDDCHGESYEIFDCMSEFGKVKPLRYKGWQPRGLIEVVDETGKVVLRGYGEDHYFFLNLIQHTQTGRLIGLLFCFSIYFSIYSLSFSLIFFIYFFAFFFFSVFLQTLPLIRQEFQCPEKCSF